MVVTLVPGRLSSPRMEHNAVQILHLMSRYPTATAPTEHSGQKGVDGCGGLFFQGQQSGSSPN